MRIAVISDSHDRLPPHLPEAWRQADEIWHLGDVCEPEVLVELEQLGPPLTVVRGNCDAHPWPLTRDLIRGGVRCWLEHIPPRRVPAPGVQLVLHGHTHVPRDETDPSGVRWLNPGCLTRPNRGAAASWAWLELAGGRVESWRWVPV